MIIVNGRLTPDYKDWDRLHSVVDVDNSPQEASRPDPGMTTDHMEGLCRGAAIRWFWNRRDRDLLDHQVR